MLNIFSDEHLMSNFLDGQRSFRATQNIECGAPDCSSTKPFVGLPAANGDIPKAVRRVHQLNDGLDMHHGFPKSVGVPLIVQDFSGQLGMELVEGVDGLMGGDFGVGHALR